VKRRFDRTCVCCKKKLGSFFYMEKGNYYCVWCHQKLFKSTSLKNEFRPIFKDSPVLENL